MYLNIVTCCCPWPLYVTCLCYSSLLNTKCDVLEYRRPLRFVTLVYFRFHKSSLQYLFTMCSDPLTLCLGAVLVPMLCIGPSLDLVFSDLCWSLLGSAAFICLLICLLCSVKVKVTLRLTVSQSVSLGIETHLGPMTRYLFLSDSYVLVSVGRPLWREDGSVFCMCPWPLPAQSFSGPSPLGLATIFYCLRFETYHFVASYDSQGHGGGIRPRLHTGLTSVFCLLCAAPEVGCWRPGEKTPCHRVVLALLRISTIRLPTNFQQLKLCYLYQP
jgi:hypothetical protein